MRSTIIEYVDNNNEICISIGSEYYVNDIIHNCRQIIGVLDLDHTESDREYFGSLTPDELLFALSKYMQNNEDMVMYPN